MNDPQIWTLIAVFTTIMLGGMTLMTTLINRATASGFKAVDARFETVDARFQSISTEMSARFETVNTKLDHLDRDVAALAKQVWGDRRTDS